ncbi:hypothetical protein BDV37DRAFT_262787 [Aspergillus pseudonomiae]|uniref:Uncharacterized protein n=1 Tax=Aspergillus pseudonomiae TaxID=1506151 RepID=A0A5N7CWX3_9EURO|nr:uncharacterized protein BDV37DRAFT_262787 [Aspergillus pseudonomiae]KAE8398686.1 hypothetical protein BDV37DRAFT_262787 [Aspergillus pseudonomiae]
MSLGAKAPPCTSMSGLKLPVLPYEKQEEKVWFHPYELMMVMVFIVRFLLFLPHFHCCLLHSGCIILHSSISLRENLPEVELGYSVPVISDG